MIASPATIAPHNESPRSARLRAGKARRAAHTLAPAGFALLLLAFVAYAWGWVSVDVYLYAAWMALALLMMAIALWLATSIDRWLERRRSR